MVDTDAGGPLTHFGEFFIGRPDPKYLEDVTFPDRTGVNNLDFEWFRAADNAFGNFSETMSAFGSMMTQTSADYIYENQAVTFLDNHDVTRFRYVQPNDKPFHAAIATLMTARGTPNVYYGTEQYLSSVDASDIAGRVFMETETAFSQATTAYLLIKDLAEPLGTTIPRIGDVVSTMGRAGNRVYIFGTGLGGTITVKFDSTNAAVVSNTDTKIEATVPAVGAGIRNIRVVRGANTSNQFRYDVLSNDQVQVIFKVNATTVMGQNVHVVGNIPELGSWNPAGASEAMLNPNYPEWLLPVSVPKSTALEFKFIKKDGAGNVTWEGGSNRTFTSPSSQTGTSDTTVYTWQP